MIFPLVTSATTTAAPSSDAKKKGSGGLLSTIREVFTTAEAVSSSVANIREDFGHSRPTLPTFTPAAETAAPASQDGPGAEPEKRLNPWLLVVWIGGGLLFLVLLVASFGRRR